MSLPSCVYPQPEVVLCQGLTQAGAGVGALDDRPLAGVVEHRPLGQGDVSCHSGYGYPAGEHSTHTNKQEWDFQPQPIPKGKHSKTRSDTFPAELWHR